MSNTVYVPTPPYVMSLSQASWQGSCASGTHRCPTLSAFPRHILTTPSLSCPLLYCYVYGFFEIFILSLKFSLLIFYWSSLCLIDGVIARVSHPVSWV